MSVNKFYDGSELDKGTPKKAISWLQKMNLLSNTENAKVVVAKTLMGVFYEAIIVSDRQLIYYSKDLSKKPREGAIPLSSISGVSISTTKMAVRYLCITVGGAKEIILPFMIAQNDLNKLYNYLLDIISKRREEDFSNKANCASSADELIKFKNLLDAGAITQEEYNAKKKQLLGL